MKKTHFLPLVAVIILSAFVSHAAYANSEPRPYKYELDHLYTFDTSTLPAGVTIQKSIVNFAVGIIYAADRADDFVIVNSSDTPLTFKKDDPYHYEYKFVSGKMYGSLYTGYSWKEGDIFGSSKVLTVKQFVPQFSTAPIQMYSGDTALTPVPAPQAFELKAFFGETPITIKGTVTYLL
ncbi:hypothetical protein KW783_04295, partial [Candidatus Parcubacteria bacterium]|nr:hypothetical protein [Candidatus Parcubacteria bacterium]